MATSGERRALMFLAAVAVLGAGTRVIRSRQAPVASVDLDRQIEAVDSAGIGSAGRRVGRSVGRQVGGSSGRRVGGSLGDRQPVNRPTGQPAIPIDLDRATAEEIDLLPGIGPAIAQRIVSDRDSFGAFGCLAALDAVKGIGPAILRRLDSLATFSGPPRPACSGPPASRPGGQYEQQEDRNDDDDHGGNLVRAGAGWECLASPAASGCGHGAALYPGPGFGGTFHS